MIFDELQGETKNESISKENSSFRHGHDTSDKIEDRGQGERQVNDTSAAVEEHLADVREQIHGVSVQTPDSAEQGKRELYKGSEGGYLRRGMEECEAEWNVEEGFGPYSFDQMMMTALEHAKDQGRSEVVVFDFGCGEANLFKDFIEQSADESKAKAFLEANPDIKLRFVGITDPGGLQGIKDEHKKPLTQLKMSIPDISGQDQIEAHRTLYTVTAAQPLERMLEAEHLETIDVALATQAMEYLSPKNFEKAMESLIKRLSPKGGKMVVARYADRVPGFARVVTGAPELDIRTKQSDRPGLKTTLFGKGVRFYRKGLDRAEEVANLELALSKMQQLDVLTQSEIDQTITEALPWQQKAINRVSGRRPDMSQLQGLNEAAQQDAYFNLASLLHTSENKLGGKKMEEFREQKKQSLNRLQQQFGEGTNIRYGNAIIEISRTGS